MMNKKCKKADEFLIDYHENSLSPNQRRAVEDHLAGCESCRLRLRKIEQVYELLAEDKVPSREESFWVNFLPEVRSRIEDKVRAKGIIWPKTRWLVGLTAVLIVVIAGSLFLTRENEIPIVQDSEQAVETSLALYDPYTYADQLADALSSDSGVSFPVEVLLDNGGTDELALAEEILEEDYIGQTDVDLMLSELSLAELKQIEENIASLKMEDIL